MSREILLFFYIYWFEKHVLEIDREAMNRTQLRSVDQGKLCTGHWRWYDDDRSV
jgi:hypothetical protein